MIDFGLSIEQDKFYQLSSLIVMLVAVLGVGTLPWM
jgi:hypothetical protein